MNAVPSGKVLLDTNIVSYLMRGGELAQRHLPHLKRALTPYRTEVSASLRTRSRERPSAANSVSTDPQDHNPAGTRPPIHPEASCNLCMPLEFHPFRRRKSLSARAT